jgi:hypothetical protein
MGKLKMNMDDAILTASLIIIWDLIRIPIQAAVTKRFILKEQTKNKKNG